MKARIDALRRRFRLWRWDRRNGDVLDLAVMRQTQMMGHGYRSWHLDQVIDGLRRDRAAIEEQRQ